MAKKKNDVENESLESAVIGKKEVIAATATLKKYKDGKANLESRIIENEEWWKLNHWEHFKSKNTNANEPRPTSAWLFNSINNKHADAMDNYPEPNILPREESDKDAAKTLTSIIPVVLENNEYEDTYSSAWWDKLKSGTAVYGVFWNNSLMNGLGDVDIKDLDMVNMFWEPGVQDIQRSKNLFIVELIDNDILEETYPQIKGTLISSSGLAISEYVHDDTVDTKDKAVVVDWYYKKNHGKGDILHYVKYVNDTVLYATENTTDYAEIGYYNHGKYPVVFDTLFKEKGSPAGFGYIDIMKDPQMYIDKLDGAILKNAISLARPRYFSKDSGNVNETEYADLSKDFVHVSGNSVDDTSIKQIKITPIPAIYLNVKESKIEELKETSGNRDFSQGGTSSGVTAASAIAALQEAGSKTSRDMIKGSYRAFTAVCNLVIELVRQFYDEPRSFRITGQNGNEEFTLFDNSGIKPANPTSEFGVDVAGRLPVFDIKVKPQKSSPFSKIAQNELAKEMYNMGFFNPQLTDQALACIDIMDFEGKDSVVQKIQQNGTMFQQIQQMQIAMQQMAALIAQTTGDTRIIDAIAMQSGQASSPALSGSTGSTDTNAIGDVTKKADNSRAGKARATVAQTATPRV